jgi:hypothetical protein
VFFPTGRADLGMTGDVDPAIVRAALPFARDATKAPPAAPVIAEMLNPLEDSDVDKTGSLPPDLIAKIARGALPFVEDKGDSPAAASSASAAERPPPPPSPPSLGSTITGPLPLLRPTEPVLPFQATRSPELSLERYASLCAELSVRPAESEAIFARHGLGAIRDRLGTDLAWQERLRKNPAEYRAWQELYQRYQIHWTEQRRG